MNFRPQNPPMKKSPRILLRWKQNNREIKWFSQKHMRKLVENQEWNKNKYPYHTISHISPCTSHHHWLFNIMHSRV